MSYAKLEQRFVQLHHLAHLGAICGWDRATMMPAGGNEARAAALAIEANGKNRLTLEPLGHYLGAT